MRPPPNDALSSGLSRAELTIYIQRFGAAEEQIRRDHLISVLMAAISNSQLRDQVVFFGGTALSRTHLVDFRLSEDIDLLALAPRTQVAAKLKRVLDRGVARTHGQTNWAPDPAATKGSEPATLSVDEGLRVQVQILPADGFPQWPTRETAIDQRYSDVPPAALQTLTVEGFVAAKTAAWMDRHAPRDLYDLYGLAKKGAITQVAAELFRHLGPTGNNPGRWEFDSAPTRAAWETALAHQCRLPVGPQEALDFVAKTWRTVDR